MNKIIGAEFTPTIGTTASQLLGPNMRRTGLIVSAPLTNRITIRFRGDAVLDQGITLYPTNAPLILFQEHVGAVIREPVSAISAVAGQVVYVMDLFEG